jgi:hypothetical protein
MIRVTVELLPHGNEIAKRTLAVMEIANDGTGTQTTGNYNATLVAEYTRGRHGRVEGFNRKQQSVCSLVGAFLKLFGHTKHSPKLMSQGEQFTLAKMRTPNPATIARLESEASN